MKLNAIQLSQLIALTVSAKADALGCDGCFEVMDQLAQAELDRIPLSSRLEAVRNHIEQCKCCRDEYDSLLTALKSIN